VLRADPTAAKALKGYGGLDCSLGYAATPKQLSQVRSRTLALNRILAEVCSEHPLCLYDGGNLLSRCH